VLRNESFNPRGEWGLFQYQEEKNVKSTKVVKVKESGIAVSPTRGGDKSEVCPSGEEKL